MSKKNNMIPMPTGGSVLPKVYAGVIALGLLAVVIKHPGDAAASAKALFAVASATVDGIASFFQQLGS
ncbi:MAG TPA: hypothetical protein VJ870_04570 [Amycolatopsis sp.]|nr:hypothetical protein [Amycolatopsis sp.]